MFCGGSLYAANLQRLVPYTVRAIIVIGVVLLRFKRMIRPRRAKAYLIVGNGKAVAPTETLQTKILNHLNLFHVKQTKTL